MYSEMRNRFVALYSIQNVTKVHVFSDYGRFPSQGIFFVDPYVFTLVYNLYFSLTNGDVKSIEQ